MYLLDTDTISNLLDRRRHHPRLQARYLAAPSDQVWISVVSVEEILRGALDGIRQAQGGRRSVADAYAVFAELFQDLHRFRILAYTEDAQAIYRAMPPAIRRIGTNDCRIAASAFAAGLVLVTSNLTDFARIAGLVAEDWIR